MALLLFDGFEFAPSLRNGMTFSTGTMTSVTGRDGIGKGLANTSQSNVVMVPLPGNLATCIFGVGLYVTAPALGQTSDGKGITLWSDAGAQQQLSINFAADSKITLRRGAGSGTVIATSTLPIPMNAWIYLEAKATINDTTGTCIVKVNGVEYIDYTGDTRNAGTLASVSTLMLPASSYISVDDLVVLDATGSASYNDFIGDRAVRVALPDGNGALSEWVGSDGNSVNNYLLVDDNPWSSADYVGSATPGDRDFFDMAAVAGLATVDAVQVVTQSAKSDAGARSLKTVLRGSAGTTLASSSLGLSLSFTAVQGPVQQTDAANTAWTLAKVNSHQYGIEVV